MKRQLFLLLAFVSVVGMIANSCGKSTINGHEYVDLGLPSGTLWATCNVGADSPEEFGYYFAWGETTIINNSKYTYTDNPTTLPASADVATVNWGSGWRMPTYDEMNELQKNCIVIRMTKNGVTGSLFTGPNGKSIFLPAAGFHDRHMLNFGGTIGYYWSSSLRSGKLLGAWHLFCSDYCCMSYAEPCSAGLSVRPVCAQ